PEPDIDPYDALAEEYIEDFNHISAGRPAPRRREWTKDALIVSFKELEKSGAAELAQDKVAEDETANAWDQYEHNEKLWHDTKDPAVGRQLLQDVSILEATEARAAKSHKTYGAHHRYNRA